MTTTTAEIAGKICMVDTSVQSFFAFSVYDETINGEEITEKCYVPIIAGPNFKEEILDAFVNGERIVATCQDLEFPVQFNEMDCKASYELIKVSYSIQDHGRIE